MVGKKKKIVFVWGWDRKMSLVITILSTLRKPCDANQWSPGWFHLSHSQIHDQFLWYNHSACLVMPNIDTQDDFFYPIHTFMINFHYITTQQPLWCQTVILRMIPFIPFSHSWSNLIISPLSNPYDAKQWSSGWFQLSHSHIHDQFLLYYHSASLVLQNSDS